MTNIYYSHASFYMKFLTNDQHYYSYVSRQLSQAPKACIVNVFSHCLLCFDLRWHARHSVEVNENLNLHGLQSGPGLLLVSGLGFALGQSCFILKRLLVAH